MVTLGRGGDGGKETPGALGLADLHIQVVVALVAVAARFDV